MSKHDHTVFDDNCEGCEPAVFDPKTGEPAGPGVPAYDAVMKVWGESTLETKRAFHAVTVLNSRKPNDMRLMQAFITEVEALGR